jgi:hypothetical protein
MDLLQFDQTTLYFDDPVPPGIEPLLLDAAASYGEDGAEACCCAPISWRRSNWWCWSRCIATTSTSTAWRTR